MNSPYSNKIHEFTIAPGCPWYDAQQSFGAPNVNWCEPTICSIINEPANTWSNLPYIFVGLLFIRIMKDPTLKYYGPVIAFMGLMSFIYHATNNYFTQLGDFVGMFMMMSFALTFNLQRVFGGIIKNFFATFWFFVFLNTLIFISFDILDMAVQKIMLMNTIPILFLDLLAGFKEQKLKSYKYFVLAILFLGTAQAFAIIDIKRIYCVPENTFLHGHVIWHLLGAVSMLFIGLHFKRMKNPRLFH